MPTIKLSIDARDAVVANGIRDGSSAYLYTPSFAHSTGRVRIMKGTLPSQTELDNLAPDWSRISGSPPKDVLIEIDNLYLNLSQVDGALYFEPRFYPAIQSGVATWWCWTGKTNFDPRDHGTHGSPPTDYWLPCIAGTVSQIGGSPVGDMTLPDINITAGNIYQVGPFRINIPETFTWGTVPGNDSFTKLLVHSDTFDGDTTAVDSSIGGTHSPHTVQMLNGAQHSTARAKFGATSMRTWSGSPSIDEIKSADDTDWSLGSSDFAVDCWVNFNSLNPGNCIASHFDGGAANQKGWLLQYSNSNNALQFTYTTDGITNKVATTGVGSWTPSLNTWYHVAATRSGTDLRLFIDGMLYGSPSTYNMATDVVHDSTSSLRLGSFYVSGAIYSPSSMDGYIDEFRLSIGTPRWTSNFTPPAYPYG